MNNIEQFNEAPMLLTVEEASKVLGVGRNTLLKFKDMKGFPALRLRR